MQNFYSGSRDGGSATAAEKAGTTLKRFAGGWLDCNLARPAPADPKPTVRMQQSSCQPLAQQSAVRIGALLSAPLTAVMKHPKKGGVCCIWSRKKLHSSLDSTTIFSPTWLLITNRQTSLLTHLIHVGVVLLAKGPACFFSLLSTGF